MTKTGAKKAGGRGDYVLSETVFKKSNCPSQRGPKAMNVKGGDEILVVIKGNVTILMPKPKKYAVVLSGIGKGVYPREYLKRERRSW